MSSINSSSTPSPTDSRSCTPRPSSPSHTVTFPTSLLSSPSILSPGGSTNSADTVRAPTIAAQERSRPYDTESTATPLQLRFMAESLAFCSHCWLSLDDVQKGRQNLTPALSTLPDSMLKKAYRLKLADRKYTAQRISATLAEVEAAERHREYLLSLKAANPPITDTEMEILEQFMGGRSLDDLEDDGGFYRAVYLDELGALSVADALVAQMKETMLSRTGCWSVVHDEPTPDDGDE